ncbi:hypothetical protein PGT21_020250 [Puccinia graminis f. sp. tritici]|uniref:Uncharacterized protein n=1 Tax=Puccinia graminis f. sp. tritici TaxID=56615 RepID=A0A5B0M1X7_PUCGR|nr:hypothetical protein PGT21_025549 [Puccinia graminis f. sp. tritici]KAA1103516.1 hypothetical protein PGT21_020250 [Puccinia graminis f. sp. tritici]KAA1132597.1 hypothetical protein PGTUg99_011524 [Puccinia graminis f. sp. tritici]
MVNSPWEPEEPKRTSKNTTQAERLIPIPDETEDHQQTCNTSSSNWPLRLTIDWMVCLANHISVLVL